MGNAEAQSGQALEEAALARQRRTLRREGRTQVGSRPRACWARAPPPSSSTGSAHASRVPAAGRPCLAPWCRSTAQLAEAPRGSATFKIQDKGSRPSRSPEGACSGGTGEFRPCVGPARGGRQLTPTGEQSLPCRLPGAVPSIRRVSFQVSAAHTAHSAPARLQSTWPGRGRSALQTGLGPHQGLKRVSSLAAVTEKRTLVLEPRA